MLFFNVQFAKHQDYDVLKILLLSISCYQDILMRSIYSYLCLMAA